MPIPKLPVESNISAVVVAPPEIPSGEPIAKSGIVVAEEVAEIESIAKGVDVPTPTNPAAVTFRNELLDEFCT